MANIRVKFDVGMSRVGLTPDKDASGKPTGTYTIRTVIVYTFPDYPDIVPQTCVVDGSSPTQGQIVAAITTQVAAIVAQYNLGLALKTLLTNNQTITVAV